MREHIETDRLVLKKPELKDATSFARQINDREITRMTCAIPYPYFSLCAEFWIMEHRSKWDRKEGFAYCVFEKNGPMVGVMDVFKNGLGDFELGYWIGRDHWGKGYATEAAHGVLREAFQTLAPDFIDAGYYEDNSASGKVLSKLGFSHQKEFSNFYSVSRGKAARGVELRLFNPLATSGEKRENQSSMI